MKRPDDRINHAYFALFVLFFVSFTNYFDRFILAVLQEPMKRELLLQDWQLGVISGPAFALFYSVAGIPMGRLADRFNRTALLAAAVAAWTLMTALCGFARGFAQLALCRVGVGMGEGGSLPTSHSLVTEYFPPQRRGIAMAAISAGAPVAALLAPSLGGMVVHFWGWRAAFLTTAVPGLIAIVLIAVSLKDPRRIGQSSTAPTTAGLLSDLRWFRSNPTFAWLVAAAAFNGMATVGIMAFEVSYFVREFGLNLPKAGGMVGLMGLFGLFGIMAGGSLADRFSGQSGRSYLYVPAMGAGIAGVFFLLTFCASSWLLAVVWLCGASFSADLKNGPTFAAVQNLAPNHLRATASALFLFGATALGTGLGPLLVGLLSDHAAQNAFKAVGEYATLCKGGYAALGVTATTNACAAASAAGLRIALIVISCLLFVAMTLYLVAGRGLSLISQKKSEAML